MKIQKYLSYIFENESFYDKLKGLEIDIDKNTFFFNLHFYTYNLNAWFSKDIEFMIEKRNSIFIPDLKANMPKNITDDIDSLLILRDYIFSNNYNIEIKSQNTGTSYSCVVSRDRIKIINKIHNDSCIVCEDTLERIDLSFNISKHVLIQFLLNPFWTKNTPIEKDNRTSVIMENICIVYDKKNNLHEFSSNLGCVIDVYYQGFKNYFIKNIINPTFENNFVNFTHIQDLILEILSFGDIRNRDKKDLWGTYTSIVTELKSSENKYLIGKDIDTLTKPGNKKRIEWDIKSLPYDEDILESIIDSMSRETIFDLSIDLITKLKEWSINCNDIFIIAPFLVHNKLFINILPYFICNSKELPYKYCRHMIIHSFFEYKYTGSKYISYSAIDYFLKNKETTDVPVYIQMNTGDRDLPHKMYDISLAIEKFTNGGENLFKILNEIDAKNIKVICNICCSDSSLIAKALAILFLKNIPSEQCFNDLSVFIDANPETIYRFREKKINFSPKNILKTSMKIDFCTDLYSKISTHDVITQYLSFHELQMKECHGTHAYSYEEIQLFDFLQRNIKDGTYLMNNNLLIIENIHWKKQKNTIYDLIVNENKTLVYDFNVKLTVDSFSYMYINKEIYFKKIDNNTINNIVIDTTEIPRNILNWYVSLNYTDTTEYLR
jgi:hypothetical protein